MKAYKLLTFLFTILLATAQASQQDCNNKELENEYKEFEEGMANKFPEFRHHKDKELEKLQEGKCEAVLVIGQTGAGKSTLIGGLLSHKFALEKEADEFSDDDEKVLVNTSPDAPKISHSTVASETIFPEAFLDQQTNLAFIDTAGLSDTRKYGDAINLCNAIALRMMIENIGNIKCIIGVISYNNFIEGRGSKAFLNLSTALHNLLKNKSLYATCTSSIVLAFTKVPEDINKHKIAKKLKRRCKDYGKMRENNEMTKEDEQAEIMLKVLFPSFYGVNVGIDTDGININKRDVPFFLIKQGDLLKQGLVRTNMLPILQKAQQINKKDIGRFLAPSLLQKTQRWLRTRAESVGKDIRDKENVENNIAYMEDCLACKQQQLSDEKKFLQQLETPNNKKVQSERVEKCLNTISQKNSQRIQELNKKIKTTKKKVAKKTKKIKQLNTNEIIWYENISYVQHGFCNFDYTYNDVPIHHIIYSGHKAKEPKLYDWVDKHVQVVFIDKNYQQGKLKITIKYDSWCGSPKDFQIYAKKKDIYHNKITTLKENIDNLNKGYDILKEAKEQLEKEALIEQIKDDIETNEKKIKIIQRDVENLNNELNPLLEKLKQNEDIPYIITHVAPFIGVHNNQQHNIDACKRYVKSRQKNNQNNNNIEDDEERKEDDSYKENISSFNLTSSLLIGTTTVLSGSLLKKKN